MEDIDLQPLHQMVTEILKNKSQTYRGFLGIDNPRKQLTKKQKAKKKAKRRMSKRK